MIRSMQPQRRTFIERQQIHRRRKLAKKRWRQRWGRKFYLKERQTGADRQLLMLGAIAFLKKGFRAGSRR